jgi:dsDNA-binding SOS-regulon protein
MLRLATDLDSGLNDCVVRHRDHQVEELLLLRRPQKEMISVQMRQRGY